MPTDGFFSRAFANLVEPCIYAISAARARRMPTNQPAARDGQLVLVYNIKAGETIQDVLARSDPTAMIATPEVQWVPELGRSTFLDEGLASAGRSDCSFILDLDCKAQTPTKQGVEGFANRMTIKSSPNVASDHGFEPDDFEEDELEDDSSAQMTASTVLTPPRPRGAPPQTQPASVNETVPPANRVPAASQGYVRSKREPERSPLRPAPTTPVWKRALTGSQPSDAMDVPAAGMWTTVNIFPGARPTGGHSPWKLRFTAIHELDKVELRDAFVNVVGVVTETSFFDRSHSTGRPPNPSYRVMIEDSRGRIATVFVFWDGFNLGGTSPFEPQEVVAFSNVKVAPPFLNPKRATLGFRPSLSQAWAFRANVDAWVDAVNQA